MSENDVLTYNILPFSPMLRTMTLDQQIDWFEDSLQKWVFQPAKVLLDTGDESVDFAVLGILNAVPEMLAKCQGYEAVYKNKWPNGNKQERRSKYLYRKGIEYIFPNRDDNIFEDKELVKLIYGNLRNGLAHFAFVGEKIYLARDTGNLSSVIFDRANLNHMPNWDYVPPNPLLSVNVPEWYAQTKKRVCDYVSDLRDPANADLRCKFSERITRGDALRKGAQTGCVCATKQRYCMHCASTKFPASHL